MKLSISNIIWDKGKENLEGFLSVARERGLQGVELAPSCFWEEPTQASKFEILWLQELLSVYNLRVSALHSITYTREDLEIFNSPFKRMELTDYIGKYVELARELNCTNIVFGSPKSRKTYGKSKQECDDIFHEFLNEVDNISDGVNVNIEPLHFDSCEYINTLEEAIALLEGKNYKNIKVQLDVRSLIENGESSELIEKYQDEIVHCQVSDPGLSIPGEAYSDMHSLVRQKLEAVNYTGFIAGEIINSGRNEKISYLNRAIDQLKKYYE